MDINNDVQTKRQWRWIPSWQMLALLIPNYLLGSAVHNAPTLYGQSLLPLASIWVFCCTSSALLLLGWGSSKIWFSATPVSSRWGSALRLCIFIPCVLIGILQFSQNIHQVATSPQYFNGSLGYLHIGAEDILHGQNPYDDQQLLWKASQRWPILLPTPMLIGIYSDAPLRYPSPSELQMVMSMEVNHVMSRNGEFDQATAHDYPAGAYWLVLPLVLAGGISIQWINLLAILIMMVLVLHRTPKQWRFPMAGILICQSIVFYTSFDALCIVFVIAAWHTEKRGHLSAGLLGMACAVKQLAWFFLPFYLIDIAHREGWQIARRRGIECGIWFLVCNLPFVLINPTTWFSSILVPMHSPMFPGGIGIIALALGGLLPLWKPIIYSLLEFGMLLLLTLWYGRQQHVQPIGIILALIPLLLAWRSFGTYFSLTPLLALWLFAQQLATANLPKAVHLQQTSSRNSQQTSTVSS